MGRNKNIDIYRGAFLLCVVIYHIYILAGCTVKNLLLHNVINLGGEIGVIGFFILSGFGIYCNWSKNEKTSIVEFIKKRMKRILPQYYVGLIIAVFVGGGVVVLNGDALKHILTHVLFIHNLWPSTHGTINGALWTMGVIVQFYFISKALYLLVKRYHIYAVGIAVVISMFSKFVTFHFILAPSEQSSIYYFIYGRQLWSAIDNFVLGMYLAYNWNTNNDKKNRLPRGGMIFASIGALGVWMAISGKYSYAIYTDSWWGYSWHSLTTIVLYFVMSCTIGINAFAQNIIARCLLWLSKYEYGIYIWHLLIINNLLNNSQLIQNIQNISRLSLIPVLGIITIGVGTFMTKSLEGIVKQSIFL